MAAWPCLVCFCGLWSPTTQLAFSFFSYTTTPTSHSLSFVLSCLFPCPCPFPVCVCVSVGDGGWAQCFRLFSEFVSVVPPVAITPPPPTPAGLGPASFLPVPRTHPSVLSSSSSCCCCCKVDGKASEGFTNHTPPLCFVACPSLFCCVCCVVAWWAWLVVVLVATPRLFRCHQCLCFQSFTTHPPRFTTQSQSLSSSCPCAHSFCHSLTHTAKPHHHATHTRVVAGALWCLVCVCAHGVGCGRAWLATHTSTHSLCPTPHHSSSCCCCWCCWWMWWWQRGCCGVCGHLVHSLAVLVLSTPDSHTHGVMGTWWWWLCVVWLPPPLCAFPTNHHHCVRCPALSAVCVSEWWHHAHPPTVVPPTLLCVCVSERRGHHTHHPRCRPMCPLSPLTRHATPATLSQMPRLTSLTHMACFVWLLPSTHTHTGWLTAHTPSTHHHHWVCVCSSTCSHPPHTHTHTRDAQAWPMHGWLLVWSPPPRPLCPTITHTQRDWWCGPWWCLVVRVCPVCASHATITLAFPPTTTTNALVPPPPSHTHTRDLVHAPLPHTHTPHAPPHTPRRAVC